MESSDKYIENWGKTYPSIQNQSELWCLRSIHKCGICSYLIWLILEKSVTSKSRNSRQRCIVPWIEYKMASFGFQSPLSMPRGNFGSPEPACLTWGSSRSTPPAIWASHFFPSPSPQVDLGCWFISSPRKHTEVLTAANIKAHKLLPFNLFSLFSWMIWNEVILKTPSSSPPL